MQTSAESWACISTTGASHACQETCSGTCSAGPAPENQSCCLLVRQDQDVCHCHTVLFPKFEPVCRLHCIVHCTVQFSRKKAWLSYSYCDCDSTKKNYPYGLYDRFHSLSLSIFHDFDCFYLRFPRVLPCPQNIPKIAMVHGFGGSLNLNISALCLFLDFFLKVWAEAC